jgi:23S rRNA (adenine2503-C2)-methyltransferase
MPKVAKANHIDDLIWLCHNYSKKTKRRVSYEYILIEGVNDDLEYARELASILHDHLYFVNLIPYNPPSKDCVNKIKIPQKKEKIVMKKPNSFRVNRFKKELMRLGVPVAVRVTMGADIAGACGQLAGE